MATHPAAIALTIAGQECIKVDVPLIVRNRLADARRVIDIQLGHKALKPTHNIRSGHGDLHGREVIRLDHVEDVIVELIRGGAGEDQRALKRLALERHLVCVCAAKPRTVSDREQCVTNRGRLVCSLVTRKRKRLRPIATRTVSPSS
jgi:hypothetical protein